MTGFADQLFDDLMDEYGPVLAATEPPAPERRRGVPRPVWLAAGTAGAAGAIAAGFTVFGGAAAAYAVTQNTDGTVTVAIHQLSGIDGANSKLRVYGDHIVVVPVRPGCPSIDSLPHPAPGDGVMRIQVSGMATKDTMTVNAKGIPKGETAVLGVSDANGRIGIAMTITPGHVPSCVSLPKPISVGPGGTSGRVSGGGACS